MNVKSSNALPLVALAFLTGCAPDPVKNGTGTSGYYQQAIGLLDPCNPMPPIPASALGDCGTNELCGIRTGMTMADVISAWGKPRALGITTIDSATLVYGQFCLRFDDGKLDSISPDSRSKWKIPSGNGTAPCVPITFAEAYCQNLNDLFETNSEDCAVQSLATNAVISIAKLKAGEVGGYRLGMTMTDLVGMMGKPSHVCDFSAERATLYYGSSYSFKSDGLCGFAVRLPLLSDGIHFDNGLSATNAISSFVEAFGPPLRLERDLVDYWLTYHFADIYVSFHYRIPEDVKERDKARERPVLSHIALHYWGAGEVCALAGDRLADAVTGLTGIDRDKMYLVRLQKTNDAAISRIEGIMGRPMTAEQREKIVVELEKYRRSIKKACEEDE